MRSFWLLRTAELWNGFSNLVSSAARKSPMDIDISIPALTELRRCYHGLPVIPSH